MSVFRSVNRSPLSLFFFYIFSFNNIGSKKVGICLNRGYEFLGVLVCGYNALFLCFGFFYVF